jgi:lipopolysaccharide biosynthesis regulator YciM
MRFRTFLYILGALVVLYPTAVLFRLNRQVLRQPFLLGQDGGSLPLGYVVLLLMLLSAFLVFMAGVSREVGLLMDRRRRKKQSRRQDEIEEQYTQGLAAVVEGREDEALAHFRAALEQDSRHFNTLLKMGEVLRSQGKHAEAVEYHTKAHHLKGDDTRPLYALVEDHEAKGELDRARALLGKILAIHKQSVTAWRKLRSLHMKEQTWDKALDAHERVEKYASGGPGVVDRAIGLGIRYEMAVARLEQDRVRDAVAALRKLCKDEPKFIPAHVKLGEALRRDGKDLEAVETWYRGFELTNSPIFLTVLEEHFLEREQPMAAIEALKRCIAGVRKDTIPRFYLGKLYFRLEMLDDALAVLSSLEGRASYAPTLHYLLGRIHERRKNPQLAATEYRKVIKEMELVQLDYRCRSCGETLTEWADRCPTCGLWNTVEVNFREEISYEELGLAPAPVYTAPDWMR